MKPKMVHAMLVSFLILGTWMTTCGDGQQAGTTGGSRVLCNEICTQYQTCDQAGFDAQYGSLQECIDDCQNDTLYSSSADGCDGALRDLADCVGTLDCTDYASWDVQDACVDPNMVCQSESMDVLDICGTGCAGVETVCDDSVDNDDDGDTD